MALVHAMVRQQVEEELECRFQALGHREQPEQQSLPSTMVLYQVLGSQDASPWYQVVLHWKLELVAQKETWLILAYLEVDQTVVAAQRNCTHRCNWWHRCRKCTNWWHTHR